VSALGGQSMRGIERLVAGALLVMAVTGIAVLARTSAPDGGHAQTLQLQSPPRSHVVAALPVVVAVPEAPRRVVAQPTKPRALPLRVSVALAKPVGVPAVAQAPQPPPAASAPPAPAPQPPAAPAP